MNVEWHWVKGHAGDPGNERADQLANLGTENV
jgi:ribonuclease HI